MPSQLDPAVRKIQARLIPFLFVCYIVNYLDRFNLSFAAMDFRASLGLSDSAYGLGAGIFFAGYVLFEIPSNLMLKKLGARRWIARIMITWGLVSSAMTLVHSSTSFYILRFSSRSGRSRLFPGNCLLPDPLDPAKRPGQDPGPSSSNLGFHFPASWAPPWLPFCCASSHGLSGLEGWCNGCFS